MKEEIIEELINITKANLNAAMAFENISLEQIQRKPAPEKWSIVECIEHLNVYSDFYHPEIKKRIQNAQEFKQDQELKSSWLGKKFTKMMRLDYSNKNNPVTKPMNAMKSMNPALFAKDLNHDVIKKFIQDQKDMLDILNNCRNYNLNKIKTSISISKIIKLRLVDTLKVVIYHNERHILQANRASTQA